MGLDYYGSMKLLFCLLAPMFVATGVVAQTPASQVPPPESQATSRPVTSALNAPLFYQLLLGELNVQGGEPGTGYSLILDAARKTNDAELYQRAVDIALQSRAGDAALQAARAWKQAQPQSREAGRVTLQVLIALNRIGEIGDLLAEEISAMPLQDRAAVILGTPRAFARVTDRKEAARVVEQALAGQLSNPVTGPAAWSSIGRMREMAGDSDGALKAAQSALKMDPQADAAVFLAIDLMGPTQPLAEPMVRTYLAGKPLPEVRLAYARALLNAKRDSEARKQLQQVTVEKPDYPTAWLALGLVQLQENDLDLAEASLQRFLALAAGINGANVERAQIDAYLALAQIAEARKDYAAADRWLDKVEDPQDRISVQVRRASLLARQGKIDEAAALLRAWPERTAAEARVKLLAEVQLLREYRRYRQAYDLLEEAVQRQPEDMDLIYDQALVAERLGDFEAMERKLRQVIAGRPSFFHAYNALGYSFADRNVRLQEARELIEKALKNAPDDPMILDSMGWVEFRSGNLTQALKLLQSAYDKRRDAEIAAHLGEVLWVTGQKEQAVTVWRDGIRLAPDNEALLETLKRLQVNL